jgi:cytochrome P450
MQARLRAELRAAPLPIGARENEPLDADALAALDRLPLLDAVVRETLRLRAPVQRSVRVAAAPAVIPLASPFVDRHGAQQDLLRVAAGDEVTVPILAVQRSTALWGADAREWKCVGCIRPPRTATLDLTRRAALTAGSPVRPMLPTPFRASGAIS